MNTPKIGVPRWVDWPNVPRKALTMLRPIGIPLLLLAAGCTEPHNTQDSHDHGSAGIRPGEQVIVFDLSQTRENTEWRSDSRCVRNADGASDREIFNFGPTRRMTGRWILGFERSEFVEIADGNDDFPVDADNTRAWLDANNLSAGSLDLPASKTPPGPDGSAQGVFLVEVIGRKAICGDRWSGYGYGHLGAYSDLIVADRILKIHQIRG